MHLLQRERGIALNHTFGRQALTADSALTSAPQEVERRAGSLVERSSATPALKPGLTEFCGEGKFSGWARSAMRTGHRERKFPGAS
jgi:hypothetical protein